MQLGFNTDKIRKYAISLGMYLAMYPHRFVKIPKLSHFRKIRYLEKNPAKERMQEKFITH